MLSDSVYKNKRLRGKLFLQMADRVEPHDKPSLMGVRNKICGQVLVVNGLVVWR